MNEPEPEAARESMLAKINHILSITRQGYFRRTADSLDTWSNWHLAISGGTLVLLITSVRDFLVAGTMPTKYLYLLCLTCLGVSTFMFALARFLLYARRSYFDHILDILEKCERTLEHPASEPDELPEHLFSPMKYYAQVIPICAWLIRPGMFVYLLGLALAILYVFIFVLTYL